VAASAMFRLRCAHARRRNHAHEVDDLVTAPVGRTGRGAAIPTSSAHSDDSTCISVPPTRTRSVACSHSRWCCPRAQTQPRGARPGDHTGRQVIAGAAVPAVDAAHAWIVLRAINGASFAAFGSEVMRRPVGAIEFVAEGDLDAATEVLSSLWTLA
jgi:hypothetical protein